MNHFEVFGNALWIGMEEQDIFPLFRKNFTARDGVKRAEITIMGLGTYIFYVNGKLGTDSLYLPLYTDFEERNFPVGEQLAHRAYPSKFDVTSLLQSGKNCLCVLLGHSWYNGNYSDKAFGNYKLCYNLAIEYEDGTTYNILSSTEDVYRPSYISGCLNYRLEHHDYENWSDSFLLPECECEGFKSAVLERPLDTDYYFSDCPNDKVIEELTPVVVKKTEKYTVYDAGKNISGFPVIKFGGESHEITVRFSECLNENNDLDETHMHKQEFDIKTGGYEGIAKAEMMWFGFRYFTVEGECEVIGVRVSHSDIKCSSSFECSNDVLNWVYNTYKHTQLTNMHYGMPSDCPHIERRGYTGDGQLTCRAAMRAFDVRAFYSKWITDISDCQDRVTGHVQYTAPYTHCGGGPGGWGCAIVVLPYVFYKYYGDSSFAKEMYPQMLRYFDYLESHSDNGLVISDNPGQWCLGDWCTPETIVLPAPFINNYFYVKSLEKVIELAKLFGHDGDIPMLEKKMEERRRMTMSAYYNSWDGNFIGNRQGANAFALDMGIGTEKTKRNFIAYYEKNRFYDTGIFGTDIVTRLLFEYGREDIAFSLMSQSEPHGFGKWMNDGATTFLEYWGESRSHNHPMFGAVVAYLFEYLLGIKQKSDDFGFDSITISPKAIDGLSYAKGHITTKHGAVSVEYEKNSDGKLNVKIAVPKNIKAEISVDGEYTVTYTE